MLMLHSEASSRHDLSLQPRAALARERSAVSFGRRGQSRVDTATGRSDLDEPRSLRALKPNACTGRGFPPTLGTHQQQVTISVDDQRSQRGTEGRAAEVDCGAEVGVVGVPRVVAEYRSRAQLPTTKCPWSVQSKRATKGNATLSSIGCDRRLRQERRYIANGEPHCSCYVSKKDPKTAQTREGSSQP